MELIFLGTSAAEGIPAPFCSCDVCQKARQRGGKDLRLRSSLLIDGVLRVDESPDLIAQAQKLGLALDTVRATLVTHTHEDHLCADNSLLLCDPFTRSYTGRMVLAGPPGVSEALASSRVPSKAKERIEFRLVVPFERIELPESYTAYSLLANHAPDRLCLNYVIVDPAGTSLLYASDTGIWPEESFEFIRKCGVTIDVVIMEATFGICGGDHVHLSLDGIAGMRDRLIEIGVIKSDTPYYASHFSHNGGLLHAELEERLAAHGIVPAYDGLRVELHP